MKMTTKRLDNRSVVIFCCVCTYPHYFNRDGMDALETTLQLIAELF